MDIAEIRKKAKSQNKQNTPEPGPAKITFSEQTPDAEEAQLAENTTKTAEDQVPLALFEPAAVADQDVSDGLDRLFSIIEECEFSYADTLDQQGETLTQTSRQYLAFHLADEEYALDITQINEIIKVRELTAVPRVPAYILGIISLRGVVVPVFDLRQRLNLGKSDLTLSSRVVVCLVGDVTVGLLVDAIHQVVNLVDEDLEPPPGVLSGPDREMVNGIGRFQGRMIILLNLHRVMDLESN